MDVISQHVGNQAAPKAQVAYGSGAAGAPAQKLGISSQPVLQLLHADLDKVEEQGMHRMWGHLDTDRIAQATLETLLPHLRGHDSMLFIPLSPSTWLMVRRTAAGAAAT